MDGLLAAPIAELFELYFALNNLLVFIGVIITPLAHGATERDQPVSMLDLCHGYDDTMNRKNWQP
jgi:hypothetical protein